MPTSRRRSPTRTAPKPPLIPRVGTNQCTAAPRRARASTATSDAMLPPTTGTGSADTRQLHPHLAGRADAALELDQPEVGNAVLGRDAEVQQLASRVEGVAHDLAHEQVHRRARQIVGIAPVLHDV